MQNQDKTEPRKAVTRTSRKTVRQTKRKKPEFTKAHEAVLSGLVASQMRCWDCFKVIMALKSEKQAKEMLLWMYNYVKENDEFPSHKEMMLKAGANPNR